MYLSAVTTHVRVLILDQANQVVVYRRNIQFPFTAMLKSYYSEPFYGILCSKAKLMLLNIRECLQEGQTPEQVNSHTFEEINTMINCRYKFKLIVQPLLTGGPTALIGY